MFYDLNLEYDHDDNARMVSMLSTAVKMGYNCVAFNLITDTLGKENSSIMKTIELEDSNSSATSSSSLTNKSSNNKIDLLKKEAQIRSDRSGHPVIQLKRVTIQLKQDNQAHVLTPNNPHLANFDLVAAQPYTEKSFLTSVQSTEVDIITFDATEKMRFKLKTSLARQAIDNGIYFEINFGDSLRDQASRKNAISNARKIIDATKGQNVIISSGASDPMLLRAPYDLINLGSLFGLEAAQARKALSQNPRAVILHSQTRKTNHGLVKIESISSLEPSMKWTVPSKEIVENNRSSLFNDDHDNDDGSASSSELESDSDDNRDDQMEVDQDQKKTPSKQKPKKVKLIPISQTVPVSSKGKRKRERDE